MKTYTDIHFPKDLPFRVPEGYFEDLANAINAKTVSLAKPSSVFELPNDYFVELSEAIQQRTTALPQSTGFTAPVGYFEYLPQKISNRIAEGKTQANTWENPFTAPRLALAGLAMIFLLVGWWYSDNISLPQSPQIEASKPSIFKPYSQEGMIVKKVISVDKDSTATQTKENLPKVKVSQVQKDKKLLAELPAKNLIDYLSESEDFEEELLIEAFLENEQAAAADLLFSDSLNVQDVLNSLSEEEVEELLLEETL